MREVIKKIGAHIIAQAVVSIALGGLLVAWPQSTTIALVYILAAYLALIGVISLVSYFRSRGKTSYVDGDLITGLLTVIFALIIFIFPKQVASIFTLLLGIVVLLSGVVNMVRAMELKKFGSPQWLLVLLLNVLVVIGGILIIINPFGSAITLMIIAGVFLITRGIVDIVTYLIFRASLPKSEK